MTDRAQDPAADRAMRATELGNGGQTYGPYQDPIKRRSFHTSTNTPKPSILSDNRTTYNVGLLALEYSIAERDTCSLWRDLTAIVIAPPVFDQALRYRRALTVQALRKRGEL
jgi:hypothetical protein